MIRSGPAISCETDLEFEDFFRVEYPRLVRALYMLTGSRSEAEDLGQEAMARVFERWERLRSGSPTRYLYRVGMNLNRNRLRRLRIRARKSDPSPFGPVDPSAASDLRADVMRALHALPIGHRQVLVLTEWLRMSAEEVGRILGIKPSSARARLARARAEFRKQVGEDYV